MTSHENQELVCNDNHYFRVYEPLYMPLFAGRFWPTWGHGNERTNCVIKDTYNKKPETFHPGCFGRCTVNTSTLNGYPGRMNPNGNAHIKFSSSIFSNKKIKEGDSR